MAKKRKLEPKPAPIPEPESDEEEEEEEDGPVEEEPEPAEDEEVDEEEEEEEEEEDDDEEEDSSDSNDEYPNPNGSTAVDNPNPNGSTPVDPTSVRDLLAPLSKDQLISLLTSAAVSHPSVLKEIQTTAYVDPSHRKIFVHGLSPDTTGASLHSFFSQYGTVEDVHNATDNLTGKSKGYALVLFQSRAAAQNALKDPQKKIGSQMTHCRLDRAAIASTAPVSDYTQKIYVRNVMPEIDPGRLREFFQQFGDIEGGPLGLDKATGKPKGFVLFIYKTKEGAKRALEQPNKSFEGHLLHCSRAIGGEKIGKAKMTHTNNNFVGGAASSAVAAPAHHMAPQMVPTAGVGYNQPDPQVTPVLATNAALGQAVGQALTALGLTNIVGGLGGGIQAPVGVANSVVPPVLGGYTAGMPVRGGYDAAPPVQGGYTDGMPVRGGYAEGASERGGYTSGMPVPGGYVAGASMQGGYPAGAPVQGGYAAGAPTQGGYTAGMPVQGGYAVGAPMRGGYVAGAPVHGGYMNQGMGQGGPESGYPHGGIGRYGNHAPYR